jgi:hypothetical protein
VQLDIFEHGREVMLRNDAVHALERRDASGSRLAVERLALEYPGDDALPALRTLVEYVQASEIGRHEAFRAHEAAGQARQMLVETIHPAARRTFGDPGAASWLTTSWQALAQRAGSLAFDARHPQDHAAALWLRAGNWEAAADAVARIESWRRIPAALAWMAESRLHVLGLRATWPLLAELGWLSPALLQDLAQRSPDPLLPQLMASFEANFDDTATVPNGAEDMGGLAWFAAWVLIERPNLREDLAPAQPGRHSAPEQAMRLLVELLGLERQGRHADIVARRKVLRDLRPSLYAAYMKSR